MEAREPAESLGDPGELAVEAGRQFRQRRWGARRTLLCIAIFGLAPIPLVLAAGVAVLVCFAALCEACDVGDAGAMKGMLPWLLPACTIVAPACGVAWLSSRLSVWSGVGPRWRLLSLSLVSLAAALISCEVRLSDLPGESSISYALGNPLSWSQWLAPLMLGLWLWRVDERPLPEHVA